MTTTYADPVELVARALQHAPRDPARVSVDHLAALRPVHRAIAEEGFEIHERRVALRDLLASPDAESLDLAEVLEAATESGRLDSRQARLDIASLRLEGFTRDATLALGIDLADILGD